MRRIDLWSLGRFPLLVLLVIEQLWALPATRVQDTLFNADGSTVDGTVTISWKAFTASDGSTLPKSSITVPIVQGLLVVDLVPNENATPAGTSYTVEYLLDNGTQFVETWVVPESAAPVSVSDIRVLQPPAPGTTVSQSQVVGLVAELNSKADRPLPNLFTAAQTIEESTTPSVGPLLSLQEFGGGDFVGFRIPSLTTSTTYTLPGADGLPGQQLTTDGTGSLFWSAAGSGAAGTAYEVLQNSGTAVTQRNVANFFNGLQVTDNAGLTRSDVSPVYGATAGTITEGNDPRLSDARTPLAHASTHFTAGSDPLTPIDIGALKNTSDTIVAASAGEPALTVQGVAGQFAPVQQWMDFSGNLLGVITQTGSVFFRDVGMAAPIGSTSTSLLFEVDGLRRFGVTGFAGALNYLRFDDSGVFKDTAFQILRTGDTFVNTSLNVQDLAAADGSTTLTVQSGALQGTTNLQEWKDNAGTLLASLDPAGNLDLDNNYLQLRETGAPAPGALDEARLFLDSVTGEVSAKKGDGSTVSLEQGTGSGGSFAVFQDAETPAGTIDGVNATFTLAATPTPVSSLLLTRNGILQASGTDFSLSSQTITFLVGAIPQTGDSLLAWYRSSSTAATGDLTGNYPNPVVSGIRGRVVSSSAPGDGDCLVWNNSSSQWEPKACARVADTLQWHFASNPTSGTQAMTLMVPEGISGAALVDSRITVNTTGGPSTYNIERCTANCADPAPTFSAIYAANVSLAGSTRTATGGLPTTTTVAAGDQFRVTLPTVGSGVTDVTVALTYTYVAAH